MAQPEKNFPIRSAKKNRRRKRKPSTHKNKNHMVHGDQGHIIHAMTPPLVMEHSSAVQPESNSSSPSDVDCVMPKIKPSAMPHFSALSKKDTINNYYQRSATEERSYKAQSSPNALSANSQTTHLSHESLSSEVNSHPTPMRFKPKKQLSTATNYAQLSNSYSVTQKEYSAGGLIVKGFRERSDKLEVALIGRIDRRGKLLWSIPKGHIELGETAEIAAQREVQEETGLKGDIIAKLGVIHYSFIVNGRKVHKTVHHFLLVYDEGELSADDIEISEVKWVPFDHLLWELTYADEKKLHHKARALLQELDNSPENISQLIHASHRTQPNDYEKAAAKKNLSRFEPIPHKNIPNDSRPPERERYTYSAAKSHSKPQNKSKKPYKGRRNTSENP